MLVEISEHLLAAVESFVNKEKDRDIVVAKLWVLTDCLLDGCTAMLTVVDQYRSFHRDCQRADALR
ncbi:hypothetical protein D3C79_1104460 [compost metagenome]